MWLAAERWCCAGAVAEAGAQQAGDMMQDFKTAHLLGVSPRAQFFAMLLGSTASVFVSVGAYALYTTAWPVPGPELPAPTAMIWLDMASLVRPSPASTRLVGTEFCIAAGRKACASPSWSTKTLTHAKWYDGMLLPLRTAVYAIFVGTWMCACFKC